MADVAPRATALAAMLGGLLRAAASFAPALVVSAAARAALYFAVDLFLVIGLTGFYRGTNIGSVGGLAVTIALIGLIVVRLAAALSLNALYPAGAVAAGVGIVVLSAVLWRARTISGWLPAAFVLSIVLGVAGTVVPGGTVAVMASGVVFGGAFAVLGYASWPAASNRSRTLSESSQKRKQPR